ncbi:unnamed protein product, partial [Closterium sp. NIES-53]
TLGMGLVLGGRARVVLSGHADASWVDDLATQRSSQGYTFSLGSGSFSRRSTCSSSVLSSSCEAEIYAGAMAAQELRWLTYLLTDLREAPRSPPVLYVDNKAMLALCQEHRLEHRTKHIALRYFLARELQQRGQLRLAYVASQANTADVFTKALQPCDHQPCFAFLDWSCDLLFSPTLPMGMCMVHRFPLNLMVNADQTSLWLEMPAERTVHVRTAGYKKERVTVMLAVTADGVKLPPYVIFKRKTVPRIVVPPGPAICTPGENTELWEMPYDPINETINGYNEQRQPLLLEVICNGRRLQALVDSGASHSVCDKATLERINEKYTPSKFTATMVEGSKLQVYGEAALNLQMGPLRWKPTLPITNIKGLDLILGRDFLKKFNPEINWVTCTASIYNQDRRVPLPNWSNTGDIPEETLARFKKGVKRTMAGFVALVTNEDEGERKTPELPPAIQKLLEEFEDVLPDDLPDQLPPYRTHQHEIIEEPGSKPTFRAPYRLSPTELADMKKQIEYLLDKGLIRPSTSP